MSALSRRRRGKSDAGVDISPLIDMVFILLIFFMVTTTFVKDKKLDIERPSASSSETVSESAVRVQVTGDGGVYVAGVLTRAFMVKDRVESALGGAGQKDVLVIADRAITAERLIDVVDQCRQAGASHVGVATAQEAG